MRLPCEACDGTGDKPIYSFDRVERCEVVIGYKRFGCETCSGYGIVDDDCDDLVEEVA